MIVRLGVGDRRRQGTFVHIAVHHEAGYVVGRLIREEREAGLGRIREVLQDGGAEEQANEDQEQPCPKTRRRLAHEECFKAPSLPTTLRRFCTPATELECSALMK